MCLLHAASHRRLMLVPQLSLPLHWDALVDVVVGVEETRVQHPMQRVYVLLVRASELTRAARPVRMRLRGLRPPRRGACRG